MCGCVSCRYACIFAFDVFMSMCVDVVCVCCVFTGTCVDVLFLNVVYALYTNVA